MDNRATSIDRLPSQGQAPPEQSGMIDNILASTGTNVQMMGGGMPQQMPNFSLPPNQQIGQSMMDPQQGGGMQSQQMSQMMSPPQYQQMPPQEYYNNGGIDEAEQFQMPQITFKDRIIHELKNPLLVVFIVLIMSLEPIRSMIGKLSDKFITNGNLNLFGTIVLAIVGGIAFYIISKYT